MMASQPTRRPVAAVWRIARRAVAALRAIHDEQVLTWEPFWQSSPVAADRAGPLAWLASLDRPRLVGSDLPTPRTPAQAVHHDRHPATGAAGGCPAPPTALRPPRARQPGLIPCHPPATTLV
jgi:hypothetical protein